MGLFDFNTVTVNVLRGCENLQLAGDETAFYFLFKAIGQTCLVQFVVHARLGSTLHQEMDCIRQRRWNLVVIIIYHLICMREKRKISERHLGRVSAVLLNFSLSKSQVHQQTGEPLPG